MEEIRPLAVALAIGLLIGLEREWSQRAKERKPAGSRTFALVALCGAVAASIGVVVVAAGLVVVGGFVLAGYLRDDDPDIGLTTEIAAVAAYLLGALAHEDSQAAVALGVGVAALLASKARLHHFVRDVITRTEVEDAIKFFVVALVVLPLLPSGDRGPYGVLDPHRIWTLVVLITGISWGGYVAVRLLGSRRGLPVAGLAGGFVSGAATTGAFARASVANPGQAGAYLAGAFAASISTLVQMVIVVSVSHPDLTVRVLPAAGVGSALLLAGCVQALRGVSPAPAADDDEVEDKPVRAIVSDRPFSLTPALVLAGVLTVVLLASRWAIDNLGTAGATATAAVAGLADAHGTIAATATLVARGDLGGDAGLVAIGTALGTNTVTKVVLAGLGGGRRFVTRYALGMLAPVIAVAALLAWA